MTLLNSDQEGIALVRAVYNFDDAQEGEIKLAIGDVISITGQIDENWLRGANLSLPGEPVGSFPKSFVEEIFLPPLKGCKKLLLSTSPFHTDISGDLNFAANEVIILYSFVDDNWCMGTIGERSGMFPIAFTKEIFTNSGVPLNTESPCSTKPPHKKPLAIAQAVVDFDAQFEDEISFKDGDIINIFEILAPSSALGSNAADSNRVGRLSMEYVYIMEGQENVEVPTEEYRPKFDWWKKPESEIELAGKFNKRDSIIPSFEEQTAPLPVTNEFEDDEGERIGDDQNVECTSSHQIRGHSEPTPFNGSISYFQGSEVVSNDNGNTTDVINTEAINDCHGYDGTSSHRFDLDFCSNVERGLLRDLERASLSSPMPPPLPLSSPPHPISPTSSSSLAMFLNAEDIPAVLQEHLEFGHVNFNSNNNNNNDDDGDEDNKDDETKVVDNVVANIETFGDSRSNIQVKPDQMILSSTSSEMPSSTPSVGTFKLNKSKVSSEPDVTSFHQMTSEDAGHKMCHLTSFSKEHGIALKAVVKPPKPPKKPMKLRPLPRSKKAEDVTNDELHKLDVVDCSDIDSKNVNNMLSNLRPPVPSKPKLNIESREVEKVSGFSGFLFKSAPKRKSVFYVDAFTEDETKTIGQPNDALTSIEMVLDSIAKFQKVRESSEEEDNTGLLESSPQKSETKADTGMREPLNRNESIKVVPRRPEQPKISSLSGSGALMTGPLDPSCLISTPSSSPQRVSESSSPSKFKDHHQHPLMPSRPAPPKPMRLFAREAPDVGTKGKEGIQQAAKDYVDDGIVEDIKRRIAETEQDLEKCIMEQSLILNERYEKKDMEMNRESEENLRFYQANILGLTDELTQLRAILRELRPDSPDASPTSPDPILDSIPRVTLGSLPPRTGRIDEKIARRRREERRRKAVEELVRTESDFLRDVCACHDVFFRRNEDSVECPPSVDLEFLFGNMHEVVQLSQRFYNLLEVATNGKDFHEQVVGSCFEEVGEDLKRVHGVYCRNHDEVISALTKLESNMEAQAYVQNRLNLLRGKMMVFDLGAILIKPVQRIMKYPLLVGELIKYTEEDHPDYGHLRAADTIMREVALHINEYKRRKDLVFKYKRPTEEGFSKKISKLTVHSIKKKLNRFMTPAQSEDESFIQEENKFKDMNSIVRNLSRDIIHYLDFLQASFMDLESFSVEVCDHMKDDHVFRHDLSLMGEAYSRINNLVCKEFKDKAENDIVPVLGSLLAIYQGPREVIRKRQHKLLDFNNALNRLGSIHESEQTKAMKDELDFLRRTYEAMNVQLLEDLPKLYRLSVSVVRDCVHLLVKYQLEFVSCARQELLKVLEMDLFKSASSSSSPSSSPLTSQEVMNEFMLLHLKVVDQLSELSFIPSSFNPNVGRQEKTQMGDRKLSLPPSGSLDHNSSDLPRTQSEVERSKVQNSFHPDKLYLVTKDFLGGKILDLCLISGTLVGVIKEEDPMKNKERFFVFDGNRKGFMSRSHLKPYVGNDKIDLIDLSDDVGVKECRVDPSHEHNIGSKNATGSNHPTRNNDDNSSNNDALDILGGKDNEAFKDDDQSLKQL